MICYGTKLIGGVGTVEETVTPTPPGPEYDLFCPQVLHFASVSGYPNPAFSSDTERVAVTLATTPELKTEEGVGRPLVLGRFATSGYNTMGGGVIDENYIQTQKNALSYHPDDRKMKPETEQWLRDRIGWWCESAAVFRITDELEKKYQRMMIAGTSALHCETKEVYMP